MGEFDLTQTSNTEMNSGVGEFQQGSAIIDEAQEVETNWDSENWNEYLGYYQDHSELKSALTSLAIWTSGKGWTADKKTKARLENITGWGEDSFQSIMFNMQVVKKVNGDAFAEIIRNEKGTLINLKPMNPARTRIVVNGKGIIIRYEELNPKSEPIRTFQPQDILHFSNDRIANEIHGSSVIQAVKWIVNARKEAMEDWRRISHRSSIRVLRVDMEDTAKYAEIQRDYKAAISSGEVLIIPGTKKESGFEDLVLPPINNFLDWIRYLEGLFYQTIGVPKIIATSEGTGEGASKVGYMTFDPRYVREQTEMEMDLWNQLAIKVKFNRPESIGHNLQETEQKNSSPTTIQPNDTAVGLERSE